MREHGICHCWLEPFFVTRLSRKSGMQAVDFDLRRPSTLLLFAWGVDNAPGQSCSHGAIASS